MEVWGEARWVQAASIESRRDVPRVRADSRRTRKWRSSVVRMSEVSWRSASTTLEAPASTMRRSAYLRTISAAHLRTASRSVRSIFVSVL